MPYHRVDQHSVFLNFPFNESYEKRYVALVLAIVCVGRIPRSVLELPDHGQGRLARLFDHIKKCRTSIHDLSCVGTPVRFNMPFELGLAYSTNRFKGKHSVIIFDKVQFRLDRILSDVKGHDCYIHHGTARGIIEGVINALPNRGRTPGVNDVYRLWRKLWLVAKIKKSESVSRTLYSKVAFEYLVSWSVSLAIKSNIIKK